MVPYAIHCLEDLCTLLSRNLSCFTVSHVPTNFQSLKLFHFSLHPFNNLLMVQRQTSQFIIDFQWNFNFNLDSTKHLWKHGSLWANLHASFLRCKLVPNILMIPMDAMSASSHMSYAAWTVWVAPMQRMQCLAWKWPWSDMPTQHHPMTFPWIQKNRFDKSNHTKRMWRRLLASTCSTHLLQRSPTLTLLTKDIKSTIHISYQISKQRRFQGNPALTMLFKCNPIGINAFFCNTHGSLDPLGLCSLMFLSERILVGPGQSLGHQVLPVSLIVSSHFNVQTHSNLIQNWSNYHSHHTSVDLSR